MSQAIAEADQIRSYLEAFPYEDQNAQEFFITWPVSFASYTLKTQLDSNDGLPIGKVFPVSFSSERIARRLVNRIFKTAIVIRAAKSDAVFPDEPAFVAYVEAIEKHLWAKQNNRFSKVGVSVLIDPDELEQTGIFTAMIEVERPYCER